MKNQSQFRARELLYGSWQKRFEEAAHNSGILGEALGKMHPALSDGEPGKELVTFMQMYIDELRISARDIELELIENPVRIEDDAWQIIHRTINITLEPQHLPQITDIYNDLVRTASWLGTIRGRLLLAKAESYFSEYLGTNEKLPMKTNEDQRQVRQPPKSSTPIKRPPGFGWCPN